MVEFLSYILIALGRLVLGGYFVAAGLRHYQMRAQLIENLAARSLPEPRAWVVGAALLQIVAGLALGLGLMVTLSALLLLGFLMAVSATILNFWDFDDGPEREAALNGFMQNMAIAAGLILAAADALA